MFKLLELLEYAISKQASITGLLDKTTAHVQSNLTNQVLITVLPRATDNASSIAPKNADNSASWKLVA